MTPKIKNQKSKIKNALLLFLVLITMSCTKWLDGALPKDKNLADKQFSTERGIHSALNGLYSALTSSSLYGGRMTITDVELLAHYYFYEDYNLPGMGGYENFQRMINYNYTNDGVRGRFTDIWSKAYKTIFEINNFIVSLSESTVLSEDRKDVLLGEAYGLRAFLHFDMLRLFGGEFLTEGENGEYHQAPVIPYNNSAEVIPHKRLTWDEFIKLLVEDIETAETKLKEDPILTIGIKDKRAEGAAEASSTDIFEKYLRNYRMNYWAVQALKVRVLMFTGKVEEAAKLAADIIDKSMRVSKTFKWANRFDVLKPNDRNYIFYEEVIFGITNPDLYTRWRNYTTGTSYGSTYAVHYNNLQGNIFKNDPSSSSDISLWEDVRARQWILSAVGPLQYVSSKFEKYNYTENNPKEFFQPLMRISEMYYIIAEYYIRTGNIPSAITILNGIRSTRGAQSESLPDPGSITREQAFDILETEYYKEFYAEGQTWFFLKRLWNIEDTLGRQIFNVAVGGKKDNLPASALFPPLPESELSTF